MTIRWNAVEEYFTVVLFIIFLKLNFGLITLGSESVKEKILYCGPRISSAPVYCRKAIGSTKNTEPSQHMMH